MLAVQAGLPNHVELLERSGRLQSPWRKVLGGPAAKRKPNCQASSSASCQVIPGLSYIPLTHWPTSITRQFHPAKRPGQRRAGDKRRFSTPTRTQTTWGRT
ncbi:hypothetical protein PCANC_11647 [Puccinia coronata f. sp. avenae]|uniref:Uncharacterized protein n=1 Tax=Puccinia coronata f. sp. avenae TaxID=200324 RepID=A0A2N5VXE9_9BASI|nr:hypothetical protein PCANC_11647 [Puccinia coronata f. sp. avenae]